MSHPLLRYNHYILFAVLGDQFEYLFDDIAADTTNTAIGTIEDKPTLPTVETVLAANQRFWQHHDQNASPDIAHDQLSLALHIFPIAQPKFHVPTYDAIGQTAIEVFQTIDLNPKQHAAIENAIQNPNASLAPSGDRTFDAVVSRLAHLLSHLQEDPDHLIDSHKAFMEAADLMDRVSNYACTNQCRLPESGGEEGYYEDVAHIRKAMARILFQKIGIDPDLAALPPLHDLAAL